MRVTPLATIRPKVSPAVVCGLLPVVGAPLPLVSYGGTSAISILLGFGIVMSIQTHRNW